MSKKEEKGANLYDKQGFNMHSLQFKTWANFFLMAVLILLCLWIIQILFFKAYYRSMRENLLEDVGDEVANRFPDKSGDKDFSDFIVNRAYTSSLNIMVFNMTYAQHDAKPTVTYFSAEYLSGQFSGGWAPGGGMISPLNPHIIEDWDRFFPKIISGNKTTYATSGERGDYLIYGAALGSNYYLYISCPMLPMDSTVMVLKNQLLIVTMICLLLSLILTWFVSGRITKPITQFSLAAQKLAKGDYSVRFEGNGYTEIEDLAGTLNYATEEMGKTEALRRDFLANVSHDLRTPLTMVKAYAEMIRDISGSDKLKRTQHSQVIIDEADRLTNLVNDILNLSKLQAGTEELVSEVVDIGMLVRVVVERFHIYSEKSGYVFNVSADPDSLIMGDSKRIEQVLYNLIGNAMNYTGDDKTVTINIENKADQVKVSIQDSGKGIPPDEVESVWERYYRASTRRREVVGNGLGLSIVKNILIAHKAKYGVNSTLGRGTEFWFSMPRVLLTSKSDVTEIPKTKSPKPTNKAQPK